MAIVSAKSLLGPWVKLSIGMWANILRKLVTLSIFQLDLYNYLDVSKFYVDIRDLFNHKMKNG